MPSASAFIVPADVFFGTASFETASVIPAAIRKYALQWALYTPKGRGGLTAWELDQITLKPDIEIRVKANRQEYYGNQYDNGLSATLSEVQKYGKA